MSNCHTDTARFSKHCNAAASCMKQEHRADAATEPPYGSNCIAIAAHAVVCYGTIASEFPSAVVDLTQQCSIGISMLFNKTYDNSQCCSLAHSTQIARGTA
eukprot:16227-Heterococcus_DN1.PRE.2